MTERTVSQNRAIAINRTILLVAVASALAGYFWQPTHWIGFVLDVLVRTYAGFIAGAIAHEASHGHLGRSRSQNLWWGRIAMIPTTVPFVTFRKTHLQHHAATNIPDRDPDEFLNVNRSWEIPLRALALPHHWILWLLRNGRMTRRDLIEYVATYAGYVAIYGSIASLVGIERVVTGLAPALFLHAALLWYGFAIMTHEGYSTGVSERRSHNYYGRFVYWFSLGLSMHRLHHMKPRLAWIQMAGMVPSGTWLQQLRLQRDVQPGVGSAS